MQEIEDYWQAKKWPQADAFYEQLKRLAEGPDKQNVSGIDPIYVKGIAQIYQGAMLLSRGKLDDAIVFFSDSQHFFQNANAIHSEAVAWLALGIAYQRQYELGIHLENHWTETLKAFQRSLTMFRNLGDKLQVDVRNRLAEVWNLFRNDLETREFPPDSQEVARPSTVEKTWLFLSYAREDEDKVDNLYQKLSDAGFKPWMDKKDILPGERWESSIRRAVRHSDFFLICLSAHSASKRGWVQREMKQALDIWQEKLDGDIYLIPVRLEDCEVPENLRDFQWVDLFEDDGWARLVRAIRVGMERWAKVPPEQVQEQISNPHLEAHWKEVQRLVRTARWTEVIPLLKHIRETAPLYRSGEIETLLEQAREWRMKKRR